MYDNWTAQQLHQYALTERERDLLIEQQRAAARSDGCPTRRGRGGGRPPVQAPSHDRTQIVRAA